MGNFLHVIYNIITKCYKNNMRTISEVTRGLLKKNSFFEEVIVEGVANITEIGKKLKPSIEKELYEKVSLASVVVALHRISKKELQGRGKPAVLKRIREIKVVSGLTRFVFKNGVKGNAVRRAKLASLEREASDFLCSVRGSIESLIIVDKTHELEVKKILRGAEGLSVEADLSAITLKLPAESLNAPGMFYPIMRALALEYVSFIEISSVSSELSLIFKDGDIERAFSVIQKLIKA